MLFRSEMNRRWIDLAPLLEDASRIARFDRRWADVAIQLAADEPRPKAFADRAEITQVLIDLIRNGLEAMEEIPAVDRILRVELRNQRAGWLRLSVIDCGCGVSEERLPKLFKAFETTKPEGLGLRQLGQAARIRPAPGRRLADPGAPHQQPEIGRAHV